MKYACDNAQILNECGPGSFVEFVYNGKARMGTVNYVTEPWSLGGFVEVYVAAEEDGVGGWNHNVGYKRFTLYKIPGIVKVHRGVRLPIAKTEGVLCVKGRQPMSVAGVAVIN